MNWMPYIWVIAYVAVVLIVFVFAIVKKNKSLPVEENQPFVRGFFVIYMVIIFMFGAIIYQIVNIQYEQGDQLRALTKVHFPPPKKIEGRRGNILSDDGRLLSSSKTYYYLYMDTRVAALKVVDKKTGRTYFDTHVGALAQAFAQKFGVNAKTFERNLRKAFKEGRSEYPLYPKPVSYLDFLEVKQFPILKRGSTLGGLTTKERIVRDRPYESLASRTIGDVFGEAQKGGRLGKSGLEMYYEKELNGKDGLYIKRKKAGRTVQIITKEPEDGMDIVSTINIDLQEIAESALRERLIWSEAERGCVLLMEVGTGKIKAISNLQWDPVHKDYRETQNFCMNSQVEPGSTFKTASFLVAMEDGYIDSTTLVNTLDGKMKFANEWMKDHNGRGFGIASVATVMHQSSNVGVSSLIHQHYGKNPQKFVDGIRRLGILDSVRMEIPGHGYVKIKQPGSDKWYGTTLPWMSIGYESQVPPIYTLMLYNAIANNGTMVKPIFTEKILKDGKVHKITPIDTIRTKIASDKTLGQMRGILEGVVKHGTAKNMQSQLFTSAGKTGTAQVQEHGTKKNKDGKTRYQITFCGYFPADNPMYTCLVYVRDHKRGGTGSICGEIYKKVAEKAFILNTQRQDSIAHATWQLKDAAKHEITEQTLNNSIDGEMPNLIGLSLDQAVYLLENQKVKIEIKGSGLVKKQSVQAGTDIEQVKNITLICEHL